MRSFVIVVTASRLLAPAVPRAAEPGKYCLFKRPEKSL